MVDDNANSLIALGCAVAFSLLGIVIPIIRALGGFLTYTVTVFLSINFEFYWDVVKVMGASETVNYNSFANTSQISLIWQIIPIWGLVWIALSLGAAVSIALPAIYKILGKEPIKYPLGDFGFTAGVISTGVECLLFFTGLIFEDWSSNLGTLAFLKAPSLNLIFLGSIVTAWILLFIGLISLKKE